MSMYLQYNDMTYIYIYGERERERVSNWHSSNMSELFKWNQATEGEMPDDLVINYRWES
jgi:hypothetical protein